LCCRLLPVVPLKKLANETCQFQKFHKGCTVHDTARMPIECQLWNCRWILGDDTADLSRPDGSHYVIDISPDFLSVDIPDQGTLRIEVIQVWVDPAHRDAHRDPALRAYLQRRAEESIAGLIRFSATDAIVLFAPPFDVDNGGQWFECDSGKREETHSFAEIVNALGIPLSG